MELNEYVNYPVWTDTQEKKEQYEWYLRIKKSMPQLWRIGDASQLEQAIRDYEDRYGIV